MLSQPVDTTRYKPIRLAESEKIPSSLRAIGWGTGTQSVQPGPLNEIDLPVTFDTERLIVTKDDRGHTIPGDSGGPLFSPEGVLFGILSAGLLSEHNFTKVSYYNNWIKTHGKYPLLDQNKSKNIYIFANQAGPAPSIWTACLYYNSDNSVAEEECSNIPDKANAKWDIYLDFHGDKIIKPQGMSNLCLTATDIPGVGRTVAIKDCAENKIWLSGQRWKWDVTSPDDEAYMKTKKFNWDCLDANNGKIWIYGCKDIASPDRHNQQWQFGSTYNN
jgi:hypothetical protein